MYYISLHCFSDKIKIVTCIFRLLEQRQEFELRLASEAKFNNELLAQIDANSISYNQEKENLLITAKREREKLKEEIERLKHSLDEEVARRKELESVQVTAAAQNIAIQLQKPSKDILPSRFENCTSKCD